MEKNELTFKSYEEIKRYLSDQYSNVDKSCYKDICLEDYGAEKLVEKLRLERGWRWGNPIPCNYWDSIDLFKLISDAEITV